MFVTVLRLPEHREKFKYMTGGGGDVRLPKRLRLKIERNEIKNGHSEYFIAY
jgi:hypothetical protein